MLIYFACWIYLASWLAGLLFAMFNLSQGVRGSFRFKAVRGASRFVRFRFVRFERFVRFGSSGSYGSCGSWLSTANVDGYSARWWRVYSVETKTFVSGRIAEISARYRRQNDRTDAARLFCRHISLAKTCSQRGWRSFRSIDP